MRKTLLCAISVLIISAAAQAVTATVDCNRGPLGKISTFLKVMNPQGPNTLKISGTCRENIAVNSFDRLTLIANPGAVLQDTSNGEQPVVSIYDSRRVSIQGFTISGGYTGVACNDGSLCRLTGNTIKGGVRAGVEFNRSNGSLSGDVLQDNGSYGLVVGASIVTASGLTVQGTAGSGIGVENSGYLVADGVNVQNNQAIGIFVNGHSDLFLINSTVSNNTYDGITVITQSAMSVVQVTVTNNSGSGVGIDGLSIVDFYGGGNFYANGSGEDIWCGPQYGVAWNLANAQYGNTTCALPASVAQGATARPSRR